MPQIMANTGIIFDIKQYAIHDGPGIRTTVFFKGCPLDCWWCHNPEGRHNRPETICVRTRRAGPGKTFVEKNEEFGRIVSVDEVVEEIQKYVIFYDQSGGGVTFSGGEPLMQPEFLKSLLMECRRRDIHTAVDTSGHAPAEVFAEIYALVDLFLFDLKNMDDAAHIKYTGVSNRVTLQNLMMLSRMGNKTQIRLPMIPGITDTEENLEAVLQFIEPLSNIREVSLLPYNRLAEDKLDRFGLPNRMEQRATASDASVDRALRELENRGYRVTIGG